MAACTHSPIAESPHEEEFSAPEKLVLVKKVLVVYGYGHLAALYGLYLACTEAQWKTLIQAYVLFVLAAVGVTAGAHRLWSHRSYKATMPLQILLMVMNTLAFQNTVVTWVREHRQHHKYSDTAADPHNASRGFFFSHIGWLLTRKSKLVRRKLREIYMNDIYANPVLMFQQKYAVPFIGTVCFLLPTVIPMYFWGETLRSAWHITILRFICNLHVTFLVNSVAHFWGYKPYNKYIGAVQNLPITFVAFGEGFHNYHHVFPWDYKSSELGNNYLNFTTKFIDFFAWLGWAYDLKSVSDDMVRKRAERTGDGSNLWGWGDKDMRDSERDGVVVSKPHALTH